MIHKDFSITQEVRDSVLSKSRSPVFMEALQEWFHAGRSEELYQKNYTLRCQMCGQPTRQCRFLLQNRHTDEKLWVDHQCIISFNLAVFDGHQRLSPEDAKLKLEREMDEIRYRDSIHVLEAATRVQDNEILRNALEFYRKNRCLTPKFAFVVLKALKDLRLEHDPTSFKVSLKTDKYKDDLRLMPGRQVRVIWPALTQAQQDLALELGQSGPVERLLKEHHKDPRSRDRSDGEEDGHAGEVPRAIRPKVPKLPKPPTPVKLLRMSRKLRSGVHAGEDHDDEEIQDAETGHDDEKVTVSLSSRSRDGSTSTGHAPAASGQQRQHAGHGTATGGAAAAHGLRELDLGLTDVGGGLIATRAWVTQGPACVIQLGLLGQKMVRVRMDFNKPAFMDPLPTQPTQEGLLRLAHKILQRKA